MDIRQKIDSGYYESKLTVSNKDAARNLERLKKNFVTEATQAAHVAEVARLEALVEVAARERLARSADVIRLRALFKADLEAEFGTAGHAHANLLFDKVAEVSSTPLEFLDKYEFWSELIS